MQSGIITESSNVPPINMSLLQNKSNSVSKVDEGVDLDIGVILKNLDSLPFKVTDLRTEGTLDRSNSELPKAL